jgi:uncharacterized membrane protein
VDGTLLVMDTVLRFSSAKFCQLFIFSLRVQVFLHNLFFDHLLECLKYHVLLSHTILILIFILSSPCFVLSQNFISWLSAIRTLIIISSSIVGVSMCARINQSVSLLYRAFGCSRKAIFWYLLVVADALTSFIKWWRGRVLCIVHVILSLSLSLLNRAVSQNRRR